MSAGELAQRVRAGAGLFSLPDRGLVRVTGGDRVRWLDGMLSNDVTALAADSELSGCYATVLTPKGRIVADPHVLARPYALLLEVPRSGVEPLCERLERYVIADDVALADISAEVERLGVEGPRAAEILQAAGATALPAANGCTEETIGGETCLVAAFGWSGEAAYQLFPPAGRGEAVSDGLREAGRERDLVEADLETLEILRIEAGIPRSGAELDEEVFPDEARLESAISRTKGCYIGQEIVARLFSRGTVNHLLVGLRFEGAIPEPGAALSAADRTTGEVTSGCESPSAGAIGLGFVRREHAEPGTALHTEHGAAQVCALPFVVSSP